MRRLNQGPGFGVLQQPRGDLRGPDELLEILMEVPDNAGDDWEDISLFPRGFYSYLPPWLMW